MKKVNVRCNACKLIFRTDKHIEGKLTDKCKCPLCLKRDNVVRRE